MHEIPLIDSFTQCNFTQSLMNIMLTLDPYNFSIFFLKIYHSFFPCVDMSTFSPFAITCTVSSFFNGPTFWIPFASGCCSLPCISCLSFNLTGHTFVLGHRSFFSCFRLLWCYAASTKKYYSRDYTRLLILIA